MLGKQGQATPNLRDQKRIATAARCIGVAEVGKQWLWSAGLAQENAKPEDGFLLKFSCS